MNRDEAVARMRSNKGRYAALAVNGTVSVLLGLGILIGGNEKHDPVGDTLGCLAIVVGAGWFLRLLRMRHRLHTDRSA